MSHLRVVLEEVFSLEEDTSVLQHQASGAYHEVDGIVRSNLTAFYAEDARALNRLITCAYR